MVLSSSRTRSLAPCLSRLSFSCSCFSLSIISLSRAAHWSSAPDTFIFALSNLLSVSCSCACIAARRRSAAEARADRACSLCDVPGEESLRFTRPLRAEI